MQFFLYVEIYRVKIGEIYIDTKIMFQGIYDKRTHSKQVANLHIVTSSVKKQKACQTSIRSISRQHFNCTAYDQQLYNHILSSCIIVCVSKHGISIPPRKSLSGSTDQGCAWLFSTQTRVDKKKRDELFDLQARRPDNGELFISSGIQVHIQMHHLIDFEMLSRPQLS